MLRSCPTAALPQPRATHHTQQGASRRLITGTANPSTVRPSRSLYNALYPAMPTHVPCFTINTITVTPLMCHAPLYTRLLIRTALALLRRAFASPSEAPIAAARLAHAPGLNGKARATNQINVGNLRAIHNSGHRPRRKPPNHRAALPPNTSTAYALRLCAKGAAADRPMRPAHTRAAATTAAGAAAPTHPPSRRPRSSHPFCHRRHPRCPGRRRRRRRHCWRAPTPLHLLLPLHKWPEPLTPPWRLPACAPAP